MDTTNNAAIPAPLTDDTTYFQILIDARVSQKPENVHFSFTANKMSLTSTAIEGITWLSGGGKTFDDWTKPVMQLVDNSTGAKNGAKFNDTYDVTLDQLPLDPSKQYRVLKIPFLDPSNSSQSLAGSGHLTITLDNKAVMQINGDKTTGFSFALPSPAIDGAGGKNRWDFVEFNCATPAANSKSVCFCDTTNVDFFSMGLTIKGRQADGTIALFGIDLDNKIPVSSLIESLNNLSSDYTGGYLEDDNGNFLRFLAPDLSFTATSTALDKAINDGFSHYQNPKTPLKFTIGKTDYLATTNKNNDQLVFTQPKPFTINKPTSLEVIASTGPLNTGSTSDAEIQDAMKFIDAALNRGVFANTADWSTPANWYPGGTASNDYSKALHSAFIDSACYGFSYDDVPGAPVTSAPTIATCTSMTLVISE